MFLYRVKNLYIGQLVFTSPKVFQDHPVKLNKTNSYIIYSKKKNKDNVVYARDVLNRDKYYPFYKNNGIKVVNKDIIYSYSIIEITSVKYDRIFITKNKLFELKKHLDKAANDKNIDMKRKNAKVYYLNTK